LAWLGVVLAAGRAQRDHSMRMPLAPAAGQQTADPLGLSR